ncbi:MAG: helix-turn-helix domain-containing protein [Actinomycetota bacterium]
MRGGEFIREARKRSGLSQRELAELLGTTQAVIARWETGKRSPTFERVVQAVRACGFDLAVRIVRRDDQHALLIEETLRLSPGERLDRVAQSTAAIHDLVAAARKREK